MKHSPTPWRAEDNSLFSAKTSDAWDQFLGRMETLNEDNEQDLANAAHICLCVNAHEELKAKLLEVISIFQGRVHSTAAMNVLHEASELLARLSGCSPQ